MNGVPVGSRISKLAANDPTPSLKRKTNVIMIRVGKIICLFAARLCAHGLCDQQPNILIAG